MRGSERRGRGKEAGREGEMIKNGGTRRKGGRQGEGEEETEPPKRRNLYGRSSL